MHQPKAVACQKKKIIDVVGKFLVVLAAICCLAPVSSVLADGVSKHFDIPAQDMQSALSEFARQSDRQILFSTATASAKRTDGVKGELPPEAALRQLLRGTGLSFRVTADQTILVEDPRGTNSAASSDSGSGNLRVSQSGQASSPSPSPTQDEGAPKLEEVVVTAQKRKERLKDVPISISVLQGDTLDKGNPRSVVDALRQVAGATVIERAPGNTQIALRGIVPAEGIGASTTAFYLDETPVGAISGTILPDAGIYDLARVEVLRGPQGTVYGANALGGVVRVLTNPANLDAFEAKGRVRESDTRHGGDNFAGDLMVNVPLVKGKLAARAVMSYQDFSGFLNSSNGVEGYNASRVRNYRLKLNYAPTDNAHFALGYIRQNVDSNGQDYGFDDLTSPYSNKTPAKQVLNSLSLVGDIDWTDVSLVSATGYYDSRGSGFGELIFPGTGFPSLDVRSDGPSRYLNQEFRLNSKLNGNWQWSAGAMYRHAAESALQDVRADPFWGQFYTNIYQTSLKSKSYAVFAETTRSFADKRFELTGGLRYFKDKIELTQQDDFFNGPLVAPRDARSHKPTGRLVLKYRPENDLMVYGSYSTGFRSGQNQPPAVSNLTQFGAVDPDYISSYEVGSKGGVLGGALQFDAALYYTAWKDIQQSLTINNFVALLNAGDASGFGFDGGVSYQPISHLTLQATVGWNALALDKTIQSQGQTLFGKGERINNSAKWTGSMGGTYRIATGIADLSLVLNTTYAYRSAIVERSLVNGALYAGQSGSTRFLDASAGVERDRWSVELFGTNLLDDRGSVMAPNPYGSFATLRARPLTIGLQASFTF